MHAAAAAALDAFASPVNYCRSWLNLEPLLSLKVSTGDKSRRLITLGAVARVAFRRRPKTGVAGC